MLSPDIQAVIRAAYDEGQIVHVKRPDYPQYCRFDGETVLMQTFHIRRAFMGKLGVCAKCGAIYVSGTEYTKGAK